MRAVSVKAARSDPPEPPDLLALPPGARVLEFEIERVIGRGGFSIVYLAFDHSLHRRVALKEYLPDTLARRDATLTVVPFSSKHQETFDVGLKSFLKEARLLARFDHPSLVKVYRFWEASGTAYMAMSHYEGSTLARRVPPWSAAGRPGVETMTMKLLDAVEILHRGECLHRDIAPDNVILQRNGSPVLLDFGAARRIIREKTQALTVILKTGFAPIEQYSEEGEMEQGPWTDVYALAATLYAVITGKGPPACVSRAYNDPYVPLARVAPPGYSPQFMSGDRPGARVPARQAPADDCGVPRRARLARSPRSAEAERARGSAVAEAKRARRSALAEAECARGSALPKPSARGGAANRRPRRLRQRRKWTSERCWCLVPSSAAGCRARRTSRSPRACSPRLPSPSSIARPRTPRRAGETQVAVARAVTRALIRASSAPAACTRARAALTHGRGHDGIHAQTHARAHAAS